MNILLKIFDFFCLLMDGIFGYQLAECFFHHKWNDFRKYGYPVAVAVVYFGIGIVSDYIPQDSIFNGIYQRSCWGVLIFPLHFFYRDQFIKKIAGVVLFVFFVGFGELLSILLSVFLFQVSVADIWNDLVLYSLLKGISKIILLLFAFVVKQQKSKWKNGFKYTKELLFIGLLDLVTLLVASFLVQYNQVIDLSLNVEIAIIVCGVFLVSFVSLVIITRLSERAQKEMELKLQLQHFQLEQKYEGDIKQLTHQLRTLRHDMNNHIGIMKGLLELEQYEELGEYFSGIANSIRAVNDLVLSENKALSVLLNTKIQKAQEMGIDFQVIAPKEHINMDKNDLCSLVGNILDNAWEAAIQTEEKYVFFSLGKTQEKLQIKCENSYKSLPKKRKDGSFVTSKSDKEHHGIGMMAIKTIVEKYHGKLEIQCKDLFSLHITLTLPMDIRVLS